MLAHSSKLFARVQIHVTGTFTVPLLHRSRSGIHGYTFRMILLAPLISAFIRMPFASVQSSLDSFPCEGMRYIVSIDWYLILVNGTSLRLYCFFTDHYSDPCRFSFVFDHFDQRTKRYLNKCLIVLLPHMDTLLPTRMISYTITSIPSSTHRSIIFLDALCRISFTRRLRFSLIRFIRFV